LQSTLIAEQSKLETIKMMGARSKINAISLNVKINDENRYTYVDIYRQ